MECCRMKSFVKLDVAAIRSFSKDHRLGSIQDQPKMSFVSTHKLSTMSSKQQQRAPRVHDQMRHKKKKIIWWENKTRPSSTQSRKASQLTRNSRWENTTKLKSKIFFFHFLSNFRRSFAEYFRVFGDKIVWLQGNSLITGKKLLA